MKLSEKGKENLQAFGFAHNCDGAFSLLDDYEFDQDDFEGTICLTVDEAKELANKLKHNAEFFFLQTGEFDYDTDELWQCLTDKIELSEEGNE